MNYIVSRLVRSALLLLGVSVLCFLFTRMAPGSFFDELRLNPQISPETIAALRSHYGVDRPLLFRYAHWLMSAARGDLGYSAAYNLPVAPLLWSRAKHTLLLTSIATLLTWIVGLPLGVYTATCRGQIPDRVAGMISSFLISVPEIVLALTLLAAAVRWRIAPIGGIMSLGFDEFSPSGKIADLALHLVLPVLVLLLVGIPIVERHIRAGVIESLEAPCVQHARRLGIGKVRLLFRHVLPLAANTSISLFGLSLAGLLGGSLLIEVITGWPGLGPLILEATLARDLYVVIGAIMLSAVFLLTGNLVSDLLLIAVDPRVRLRGPDAS